MNNRLLVNKHVQRIRVPEHTVNGGSFAGLNFHDIHSMYMDFLGTRPGTLTCYIWSERFMGKFFALLKASVKPPESLGQ